MAGKLVIRLSVLVHFVAPLKFKLFPCYFSSGIQYHQALTFFSISDLTYQNTDYAHFVNDEKAVLSIVHSDRVDACFLASK